VLIIIRSKIKKKENATTITISEKSSEILIIHVYKKKSKKIQSIKKKEEGERD
jgi:hypothetical protein